MKVCNLFGNAMNKADAKKFLLVHNEKQPEKQQAYEYYLEWIKARIPSN